MSSLHAIKRLDGVKNARYVGEDKLYVELEEAVDLEIIGKVGKLTPDRFGTIRLSATANSPLLIYKEGRFFQ